ncbi:MAG TPA: YjgP/YjgQ family permease [Proteobacteria bacterium]|nr:putative permease YjgP/YjgQ family protein [bacterium BMS3Abin14]HDL52867.1 YjgP/YjgQ family permease [Pseudomonadota bacterium]
MALKIQKYIMLKFISHFSAGAGIFTALFLMDQASRQVNEIAPQMNSFSQFMTTFSLLLPEMLTYSLPLAFLMAMIATIGQMKQDQELTSIYYAGVSPLSVFVPFVFSASCIFLLLASLSIYISPMSFRAYNDSLLEIARQRVLSELKPGTFFRGIPGAVLLVDDFDPASGKMGHLLMVQSWKKGKGDIILAKSGIIEIPTVLGGDVTLRLHHGTIQPISAPEPGYISGAFDNLVTRIEKHGSAEGLNSEQLYSSLTLGQLREKVPELKSEGRTMELRKLIMTIHRRFSLPAVIMIFPFIIFPMAISSRSYGKPAAFLASIVLFGISFFLFSLSSRLTAGDAFSPVFAAWMPDAVLSVIALVFFCPFLAGHCFHRPKVRKGIGA